MDQSRFIAKHVVSLPKSGIRDFFDIVAKMKDAISLGVGEPDFDTPWHIREAGIYALEKGIGSYTRATKPLAARFAPIRWFSVLPVVVWPVGNKTAGYLPG